MKSLRGVTAGYADVGAGQLHYQSFGEGPVILLIPPVPRSTSYFDPLMHLFSRHRVVAIDTPGFGNSSATPDNWTMNQLADLVVQFLDVIKIKSASVVGVHTGNKIAAEMAANWSSRVESLVLVGMTHSLISDQVSRNRAMAAFVPSRDEICEDFALSQMVRERSWRRVLDHVDFLSRRAREVLESGATERIHSLANSMHDELTSANCYEAIYRANYDFDLVSALAKVTSPTLIVELITVQESHIPAQAEELARVVADSTIVTIGASDRRLMLYEPERLCAPIMDFLDRLDAVKKGKV